MRDYKFRGKRKGSPHEWIYGDLNHIDGKVFIFDRSENAPLNSPDWFEVDPETVGEITGLKDKNEKEIYEGHYIFHDGDFYQINFKAGSFGIDVPIKKGSERILYSTSWIAHETPELWQQK